MAAKLKPLNDKILLKRVEAESKTKSGIVLPETAKEKPKRGNMIASATANSSTTAPAPSSR